MSELSHQMKSTVTLRRPGLLQSSWNERGRLLVPALIVLVLGVVASFLIAERERRIADQSAARSLDAQAEELSGAMRLAFQLPIELLHGLAALVHTFPDLTLSEFQAYADRIATDRPEISALHFLPLVREPARAAFEQRHGLVLRESDLDGGSRPAQPRAIYLPVDLVAAWEDPAQRGLDRLGVGGDNALVKARDTGTPVASVVRSAQAQPAFSLLQALYSGPSATVEERGHNFLGLVEVAMRIEPILSPVLADGRAEGLSVTVYDLAAPAGQHTVFRWPRGGRIPEADAGLMVPGKALQGIDMYLADRWFRIAVAPERTPLATASHLHTLWFGLLISVLAAGLVAAVISLRHMRARVLEVRRLGQYVIEREIGAGSMGQVFKATHSLLRRPTALKLLSPDKIDPHTLRRFESEVQRTAGLSHPNTVAIYDFGHTDDGVFYYAMEYLDGIDLQHLVAAEGPQPAERVVHLLIQVCGALEEAHGAGLIHRDIKPANLMLCVRGGVPDFIKVLDFGLVKDLGTEERFEGSAFVGTPLYAAPEAIDAPGQQGARADLYSLGAVAFFLLSGREVFTGPRVIDVLEQHRSASPPTLREVGAGSVPAELERLIMACLAKAPDDRPGSAAALRQALEQLGLATGWTRERAQAFWLERGSALTESSMPGARHSHEPDDIGLGQTLFDMEVAAPRLARRS